MAKKFLVELGDERRARLDAFCEAYFDASASTVVRKAIDDLIENELNGQSRLRERFESALAERLPSAEKNLHVIQPALTKRKQQDG